MYICIYVYIYIFSHVFQQSNQKLPTSFVFSKNQHFSFALFHRLPGSGDALGVPKVVGGGTVDQNPSLEIIVVLL